MTRYDTGTDDHRVKIRASKSSKPRSKRRPDFSKRPLGRVLGIDRGRYRVAGPNGKTLQAVKARELGRGAVVIGDFVRLTGDVSGRVDTLARIAAVEERRNTLRRSLEEADDGRGEKIMVSNADLMVIVTAAADPQPRTGMVERCLVAAKEANISALICMTKTDLASPEQFLEQFSDFEVDSVSTNLSAGSASGIDDLRAALKGKFSVLIGHSGVGKSTLINELIPGATRSVGEVNVSTGKGRHTSTSAVALELPGGGYLVDTPGVRSFGLAHVSVADVLDVFPNLTAVTQYCLPNCTHSGLEVSCALDQWVAGEGPFERSTEDQQTNQSWRKSIVERARGLIAGLETSY